MSTKPQAPVVLELAPLPRDQVGPFLLLGVDKAAPKDVVEKSWAQRIIWARKNQIRVPLEDVNWAREAVNDLEKRVRADACTFNLDTTDRVLKHLADRYAAPAGPRPLDVEKPLAEWAPAVEVPDPAEARAGLTLPEVPEEAPAVAAILDRFVNEPLDPWRFELTPPPGRGRADEEPRA